MESLSQEALSSLYPEEEDWLLNFSDSFQDAGADYIRQHIEMPSEYVIFVEGHFNLAGEPLGIHVYNQAPLQ